MAGSIESLFRSPFFVGSSPLSRCTTPAWEVAEPYRRSRLFPVALPWNKFKEPLSRQRLTVAGPTRPDPGPVLAVGVGGCWSPPGDMGGSRGRSVGVNSHFFVGPRCCLGHLCRPTRTAAATTRPYGVGGEADRGRVLEQGVGGVGVGGRG